MSKTEIICLECPTACLLELMLDESEGIVDCRGAQCKRGLQYAQQELRDPARVLTTTVLTDSDAVPLLAVRTDRPIPKGRLQEGMSSLACLRVKAPVKAGQVLVSGFMGTGANVIAADDLAG